MIFRSMCSRIRDSVSLRLYSMYVSVNIYVCVLGTVPGRSTAELRVFRSKRNTNTNTKEWFRRCACYLVYFASKTCLYLFVVVKKFKFCSWQIYGLIYIKEKSRLINVRNTFNHTRVHTHTHTHT